MRYGILASAVGLAIGLVVVSPASGPLAAQGQRATKAWSGKTAWGDPDLQGKWETADTATPLERPKDLANKAVFTDQEVADRVARLSKQRAEAAQDADGNDIPFPEIKKAAATSHEKGIRGEEYNKFWVDAPVRKIKPWNRTSLVIDPPDGRMPPFTPEMIKRIEEGEKVRYNRGEADSWEDRNINERCIENAFVRIGGGERQILQSPGYVAFTVHQLNTYAPFIIPLDGRPRPSDSVRTWMGVARGRWDGPTLVVETTNINGKQNGGPILASRTPYGRFLGAGDTAKITERFTRVDADTIEYSYTVEDPKTYVRPYTVLRPLTKAPDDLLMPENACHEGNYGIVGQLSAGRADEEYARKAARAEQDARQPQFQEMKRRTEEWIQANAQKR
jgi:hypothetical protein